MDKSYVTLATISRTRNRMKIRSGIDMDGGHKPPLLEVQYGR